MSEMFSPRDVQKLLDINSSTLRKYATLLEEHGYHVHRNTRGHRSFYDKDVNILRKLIEFSKQEGMTLERSIEEVMAGVSEENNADSLSEPVHISNEQHNEQECNHNEQLENSVGEELTWISEENKLDIGQGPAETPNNRHDQQDQNLNDLLERIEHLEQINLDLIKLLKEKAVREACLEEKINQIVKYIERTEQLVAEQGKMMEEETRMQIAAAQQKKWWKWWKWWK
ncbi:hypothetical protein BIV60_21660 [Bacillus sp. MUM 116]|uniref:MerR family transcriptional regulator n=1 Tax=Bacillus sp. MUM 116 TaxID=1678002 RepID=UPI0008F572B3|nr:MerR family transcriptional regulator [Bacillus sp. MUM 116]OIK10357.1 hypothetical protein BIV60_21660 [Bacillus sp. MUM 116]